MDDLQIKIADNNDIFNDLQFLHRKIWGIQDIDVTPTHIYSAVNKNGGVMLCAYIDNKPVAFSFGFYGKDEDDSHYFYSHNMGVLKDYRHQGIGLLLKIELARQLLRKNVNLVKWTFDPLESANAYLNIHKLQATSYTYITNYYEEMQDSINRGVPSDRLIVHWNISTQLLNNVMRNHNEKKEYILADDHILNRIHYDSENLPQPHEMALNLPVNKKEMECFFLEIPSNLHFLREKSMETVINWRYHVRNILSACFEKGFFISDAIYIKPRFYYVLTLKQHA